MTRSTFSSNQDINEIKVKIQKLEKNDFKDCFETDSRNALKLTEIACKKVLSNKDQ